MYSKSRASNNNSYSYSSAPVRRPLLAGQAYGVCGVRSAARGGRERGARRERRTQRETAPVAVAGEGIGSRSLLAALLLHSHSGTPAFSPLLPSPLICNCALLVDVGVGDVGLVDVFDGSADSIRNSISARERPSRRTNASENVAFEFEKMRAKNAPPGSLIRILDSGFPFHVLLRGFTHIRHFIHLTSR